MSRGRRQYRVLAAAFSGLLVTLICGACASKHFSLGSVPFPADKPVFVDDQGRQHPGLPESSEPFRLVFLDYSWCPPCADAWKAVRESSLDIPAGTVRVYRVLFDMERLLGKEGTDEIAPLRQVSPPDAGGMAVTTVMALADPFRKRFGPDQAPLIILMDRKGKVLKKWTGASHSLSGAIASEVKRLSSSLPLPGR